MMRHRSRSGCSNDLATNRAQLASTCAKRLCVADERDLDNLGESEFEVLVRQRAQQRRIEKNRQRRMESTQVAFLAFEVHAALDAESRIHLPDERRGETRYAIDTPTDHRRCVRRHIRANAAPEGDQDRAAIQPGLERLTADSFDAGMRLRLFFDRENQRIDSSVVFVKKRAD